MATFTDNFNRANSNDLGSPWTENLTGDPQIKILSNEVEIDNPGIGGANGFHAKYDVDVIGPDQFSEAKITYIDGNSFGSVGVRIHFTGSTFRGYYFGRVDLGNGNEDQRIFPDNDISGPIASVTISTGDARAWGVGKRAKIQVFGSTIKTFINGIETMSVTHSGFTTGKPGFGAPGGIAGSHTNFDDWEGGFIDALLYIRTSKTGFQLKQKYPHRFRKYVDP